MTKTEISRARARLAELPDPDLSDAESLELMEADFAKMRPAYEVLPPEVMAAFPKSKGGRPRRLDAKKVVSLRLRPSLIAAYEAQGRDWWARMEAILTEALAAGDQSVRH